MQPWLQSLNALIVGVPGVRAVPRRGEEWQRAGGHPADGSNAQLPQRWTEKGIQTQTAIRLCPRVGDAFPRGVDCGQVGEGEEPGAGPHKKEQNGEWDGKRLAAS